jgi:hypothetical protein
MCLELRFSVMRSSFDRRLPRVCRSTQAIACRMIFFKVTGMSLDYALDHPVKRLIRAPCYLHGTRSRKVTMLLPVDALSYRVAQRLAAANSSSSDAVKTIPLSGPASTGLGVLILVCRRFAS